ncbi:GNAT family N-acetyltransferase [Fictibacillus barbaricus]|uniref:Acetyltransferase n=1 Tax=Fictibacillus barbaricus TaxID=182136 RepID=A0ABU1TWU8_9BACL|nr:N-acetyltransferase [Fictibacillus barbaricus]MDR7071685.1 putative acetyltransferase [Fictibacillus barbaricus]
MKIRAIHKGEFEYTESFVRKIFKNTGHTDGEYEKAWLKKIREKPFYIPEFDLVVEDEGKIIGHFVLSKFPISQKHEDEVLMLSPVSVAIPNQRQGVGEYMLREGIQLAADSGFKGIVVEGDFRYYRRFGFRTSTEFGIHASQKNLPPSEDYLMALELCENGLKNISGEVDYSMYND